jgi:hypothetical protein
MAFSKSSLCRFVTAAKLGLPVILVSGLRGRAKEKGVAFIAMVRTLMGARFRILHCLRRTWWEGHGEKKWPWAKVNVFFAPLHLGLVRVVQGTKAIGTLFLMLFECSFVQRGHSTASAAPLRWQTDHKR